MTTEERKLIIAARSLFRRLARSYGAAVSTALDNLPQTRGGDGSVHDVLTKGYRRLKRRHSYFQRLARTADNILRQTPIN